MKSIFADTSFFVALFDPDDQYHLSALRLAQAIRHPLVSTSAVILELGAHFSPASGHPLFMTTLDILHRKNARIIHVDELLLQRGIDLFQRRRDKNWSLTDCISFVVMGDEDIMDAATSDEHFEQAQFTALLRHSDSIN